MVRNYQAHCADEQQIKQRPARLWHGIVGATKLVFYVDLLGDKGLATRRPSLGSLDIVSEPGRLSWVTFPLTLGEAFKYYR